MVGFVVNTHEAHVMLLFGTTRQAASVPVGLLTAAIDLINFVKPEPRDVDRLVTGLVLRLDYDGKTASALVARIHATARMFVDPRWPFIRRLGEGLSVEQRSVFEATVQRFIAAAPLDRSGSFDLAVLREQLTRDLPARGHC